MNPLPQSMSLVLAKDLSRRILDRNKRSFSLFTQMRFNMKPYDYGCEMSYPALFTTISARKGVFISNHFITRPAWTLTVSEQQPGRTYPSKRIQRRLDDFVPIFYRICICAHTHTHTQLTWPLPLCNLLLLWQVGCIYNFDSVCQLQ